MTPEEHARASWQNEGETMPLPPIEELRARADQFRRTIVRRNWGEYAAGAFVILAFSTMAVTGPLLAMRIGAALIVGGTCVVLWQLHRRGSPLSPMEHGGQLSVLEYQRRELVRQRDALASVFRWYLLPLMPGMAIMMLAPLLSTAPAQWAMPPATALLAMASVVAVFAGIYVLNKWGARKLQSEIDEIDFLKAG
ncbi:hypothetical protein [Aurantiacibacter marinus]|uniref:hypothetical protein n=1 Tax=Aurantiacibacter marinus TaxID=874156 RepID=UPI00069B125C|nr:hypothetical protein [Aurantiacibacter marinus]